MRTITKMSSRAQRARFLDVLTELVISVAILATMLAQIAPSGVATFV